MKIRLSIVSLVAACAALVMSPAFANANQEITTAIEHAGFAAKSKDIKHVHLHLHHVMNCLVGPKGGAFDAAAGNPCKGMGNGAINERGQVSRAAYEDLKAAMTDAASGLQTNDYKTAKEAAGMAKRVLQDAKEEE
ncbi:MAG TPA: hypothetical protein VKA50_10985 [Gammaproteobacteria bacterium]|nr:hypothetical protein [Gammaproteobacteria bacterium]